MPVSDEELASLAVSHDIISIGMQADEVRRARHGTRTTFVRVAQIAADPGAPIAVPAAAGEMCITGTPASRAAAIERVRQVATAAGNIPVVRARWPQLDASTLWSFAPEGSPAYPAAVKRQIRQAKDAINIDMNILCEASKAACDKLVADFQKLRRREENHLRRIMREGVDQATFLDG